MSAASDRERVDVDTRPMGDATKRQPSTPSQIAAAEAAEWRQEAGKIRGLQLNARTGMRRYIPA